jgi:microcystin-dependent protein
MGSPFLAEIRIMSFTFPPRGWALCNGQLLPINQNQALFSLLGTSYGGNGQVNFALPDLRSRTPVHIGSGTFSNNGVRAGEEAHTVSISEMPQHIHALFGTSANADSPVPGGALLGTGSNLYTGAGNFTALIPESIGNAGGSQGHNNLQPYTVLSFCIALQGIFPSRN